MLRSLKDKISNFLPSRTKDVVLRDATKADARFVLKLINREIKEGHFAEWPSRRHKVLFSRYLRHSLISRWEWPRLVAPNPNDNVYVSARLWICMNGMKRVGFISISEESPGSYEKSVELWMVAVVPERRRKRFGKLMVDLVLNTLIELEPKRRIIARCLPASKVMFSMLRDRGFRVVGLAPDGNRLLELKPAMAFKVYSTVSARRFMSDLTDAKAKGYISNLSCYNSIFNYFESEALTPYLQMLIEESSLPLASIENDFAVDSSGFSTGVYEKWVNAKYPTRALF